MDLELKGKRAVVLGGTRGIGRATAETLAAEGADVAICARDAGAVRAAVEHLAGRGVRATGASVDIADGAALRAWIASVGDELGGIDVLVSNASALAGGAAQASWESSLQIDILGAVNAVEAAQPFLERAASERGDAAVVLVSSVSAAETGGAQAYGAIKAALVHLGKGLGRQLAGAGIRVNVVSPGTVYFEGGVWGQAEANEPERFARVLAENPLGRMGTPQEIANTVVFLASPASSFTSGSNVVVDGAITRRVNF